MDNKEKLSNEKEILKNEAIYIGKAIERSQISIYNTTKRILDIIGAAFGLILSVPIFLIICALYLFGENKGPIIFSQARIGQYGETFKIYKFRSMVVDAEQVLKSNKALYKKYIENNYKLDPEEDPRITKVGRFLRKTSLDEIPQLINVIKGEMSLVGPRPVVDEELIEYKQRLQDFLRVKPGLTGYWQVCGRSNVGYPERAELEFYYIDHQSFKMDMRIIFNTIVLVLLRKGAY